MLSSHFHTREDAGFFFPHWLLITLVPTLVTGEEWCLRGLHATCWHGRCLSRDVLLILLQPYLMFNITHQQRLEGLQLRLVRIFPDLHFFPSQTCTFHPSPLIISVQYFPWNCNNMLPKIGTMRHIAIFFSSGHHLSIWSIWKHNSTLGAIHKVHCCATRLGAFTETEGKSRKHVTASIQPFFPQGKDQLILIGEPVLVKCVSLWK